MYKLKLIVFVLLSLLLINFFIVHSAKTAERDCLEDAQYKDLWELIKSAAEQPDSLTWIHTLEDRKVVSGILAELGAKKKESDEKTREGNKLVEEYTIAYKELELAQSEWKNLDNDLKHKSDKLSDSDLLQRKIALSEKSELVAIKYADFKIKGEKVDAITEKFKLLGNDADDLVKRLISKFQEIQSKQGSFIDKKSLWKYLQNLKTQSYNKCK